MRTAQLALALLLVSAASCTTAPVRAPAERAQTGLPIPVDCPGDGPCLGQREDRTRPSALSLRHGMLDVPECGYRIARVAGFSLDRDLTRDDDGDRRLSFRQRQPEPGTAGFDAMFDHPLDAQSNKPVGTRLTARCVELATVWSPRRFASALAEGLEAPSVTETAGPNGTPMGLSAGIRRTRSGSGFFIGHAVWRVRPGLWAMIVTQLHQDSPGYEDGRVAVWPCGDVRAGDETPEACIRAVWQANDLPPGQRIWLPRSRALNEAWHDDFMSTLQPMQTGAPGFTD